ncbi:sulfhydryl oxidase 1 [Scaptodrosophila lebanonensis]|uniref:Sulfhydryl oxidase n=1 Tax=Drosophila lebanonensis TaxID=7225 RepID=A0A6J2SYA4_DROLE|nr:sulfhydryl oxidase 1 [Scaptodrosophila lebanonensis]
MITQRRAQVALLKVQLILLIANLATAAVPGRYEALMKQQSTDEDMGLYSVEDKVFIMTSANFNETVLEQNRSVLVEFYNTYCGHCRRFAPIYKAVAEQLLPWRDVVLISAIDCAAEENNGVCRMYEVMGYPTMRYMGPGFQPGVKQYGQNLQTQNPDEIRSQLAKFVAAENQTATTNNSFWPNFQQVTDNDSASSLFEGLSSQREYIALVYEPENSTVAIETALFLLHWPAVQVRIVHDAATAEKFKIDTIQNKLALIDRKGNATPFAPSEETSDSYSKTIEDFLRAHHFTPRPELIETAHSTSSEKLNEFGAEHKKIIDEVHRNKHFVYQADLEQAIRTVLHNEVPKINEISGERLLALQRFLAVLQRYNPLGANGQELVAKLSSFVVQFNQQITGKQFEQELQRLEHQYSPIYSSTQFIGCAGSQQHYRGFSCSLWTLFHYMTVQAAQNDQSQDPLEVLQAMHGYIKGFFGCTDCAEHFQAMASRRKIWSVPSKEEAILWLWQAHNEVNQRLAGDSTEDPEFPKTQFPTRSSCAQCYRGPSSTTSHLDISWNKDAVLGFLNNIYNPEFISRYGLQREELLHATAEKLRQKRQIANVFSDIDMRMGMLLYGFCIVMMVIAFKLFAFKGYRKKPYGHDLLGKV